MKVETNWCLLSITVKSLAYLQANSGYLLPFHRGWQKTQDSQERSKGFYYSWLSKWMRFRFSLVLWCPVPTRQWPGCDAVQAVGLNHSGGALNCGNPKLVSSNPAWPGSQREALLYWTVNKSALRPEEETLSSKVGHYILKNMSRTKQPVPLLTRCTDAKEPWRTASPQWHTCYWWIDLPLRLPTQVFLQPKLPLIIPSLLRLSVLYE